jgi:GR25 family glycosyltransferase involved in LPS biosynthesis
MRRIERIYVINLDRQPQRWNRLRRELGRQQGNGSVPLVSLTERFAAIDAKLHHDIPAGEVEPVYSVADQLFVEPEPLLARTGKDRNIKMSRAEVAVARSHIEIWKVIATSSHEFSLVLEDDAYFALGAAKLIDRAWSDLRKLANEPVSFDMLYLSYREAGREIRKEEVTDALFRPLRGLWQLSGYVLSRAGAQKLLKLLPVRGPVDLWINYQFEKINVYATARSVINQRPDAGSDNVYSILPLLSTAGILSRARPNLFERPILPSPVFGWGESDAGGRALAMALSILGYRCCADMPALLPAEHQALVDGTYTRVFDAYVDVASLVAELGRFLRANRNTKVILVIDGNQERDRCDEQHAIIRTLFTAKRGADEASATATNGAEIGRDALLLLDKRDLDKWGPLCAFLGCERPEAPYPKGDDHPRTLFAATPASAATLELPRSTSLRFDRSPWIVPVGLAQRLGGVPNSRAEKACLPNTTLVESFDVLDSNVWELLADTFPGNRALFVPQNAALCADGIRLTFREQSVSVRDYTAASICTVASYLYGRFEGELRPAGGSGLISGFFLHRYFPRQEIDVEFLGRDPSKLLINVYFNPGDKGSELNFGFRGTPVLIDLGFDASKDFHRYAIEWTPSAMRWFVDDRLVHERGSWDPTPIPHLPMQLFINLWSARSEKLAGRLTPKSLPAHTEIRSVRIRADPLEMDL